MMNTSDIPTKPFMHDDGSIPGLMQRAAALHNEGDLEAAEALYREVLEEDSRHPDALHLLGLLAHQLGYHEEAASLIEDAIEEAPDQALFYNHLAKTYLALDDKESAEKAYRNSLSINPDDSDTKNDLGNLLVKKAKEPDSEELGEALGLLSAAHVSNPQSQYYLVNYGNALRNSLHFDEARETYLKALDIEPGFVGALTNMGLLYHMQRKTEKAIEVLEQALDLDPDDEAALNNLANVYIDKYQLEKGSELLLRAAELNPNNAMVYRNLGTVFTRLRWDNQAMDALTKAMELNPKETQVFAMFAAVLRLQEHFDEAEKFVREALLEFPKDPYLLLELGNTLQSIFEFDEAEELLRDLIERHPNFGPALMMLAVCLIHTGNQEEVLSLFDRCFEQAPDNSVLHMNYALTQFCFGNLKEAWEHYVHRWDAESFTSPVRPFQQPLWDGSSLAGKSILVYGEQGLGDELRHASLVPDLIEMGAEVHVECSDRLVDLFQRSFPTATVHACPWKEAEDEEVDLDFQSPILDLGGYLRPTIDSFPSDPHYAFLKADPDRIAFWKERLDALGPTPKVGMIWRSGIATGGRNRWGATVEELAPIFSIPGIDFVNLMYVECEEERQKIRDLYGVELHTWDDIDLRNDQDDLSALISNLDLVISHPSAVAYLASGLGIDTFTFMTLMIYFDLLGDPDAPGWAPSMRYFRKEINDSWAETMDVMAAETRAKFGL